MHNKLFFTLIFSLLSSAAMAQDYCREYTQEIRVGNQMVQGYGTTCLQPDGSWQVQGDPQLPPEYQQSNNNGYYSQPQQIQPVIIQQPVYVPQYAPQSTLLIREERFGYGYPSYGPSYGYGYSSHHSHHRVWDDPYHSNWSHSHGWSHGHNNRYRSGSYFSFGSGW